MRDDIAHMRAFWDARFTHEGKVWGDAPSRSVAHALDLLRGHPVQRVLVPGSGYGRNTRPFSEAGYEVVGVEISAAACRLAALHDPATTTHCRSALDLAFDETRYDAIYCFNVLHLFRDEGRRSFLRQCGAHLVEGGIGYFSVFSEQEPSYGRGAQVEPNTFESKPGRPVHYFDEDDLSAHFAEWKVLDTGLIHDPEDHGAGPHTHVLRWVLATVPRA